MNPNASTAKIVATSALPRNSPPATPPSHYDIEQHRLFFGLFTQEFYRVRPTATMYLAPVTYASMTMEEQLMVNRRPLATPPQTLVVSTSKLTPKKEEKLVVAPTFLPREPKSAQGQKPPGNSLQPGQDRSLVVTTRRNLTVTTTESAHNGQGKTLESVTLPPREAKVTQRPIPGEISPKLVTNVAPPTVNPGVSPTPAPSPSPGTQQLHVYQVSWPKPTPPPRREVKYPSLAFPAFDSASQDSKPWTTVTTKGKKGWNKLPKIAPPLEEIPPPKGKTKVPKGDKIFLVDGYQETEVFQQPRSWLPHPARANREAQLNPRQSRALDWSQARPVINMTTAAPDPANILAAQIMKLEGTLHLLNAKTRFHQSQAVRSTGHRPRLGPSLDLHYLYTLLMLLVLVLSLRPTHAYTYSYFDCSQPSHLETFDRLALCQQAQAESILGSRPAETWLLLQKAPSHEVNGTSCEVRRSEFQGFCGVWGHTKLGGPPSVSTTVTVSENECLEMLQTQRFVTDTTPAGWPIRLNEEVSFTEMAAGRIWYENSQVQCEGVTVQLNGQVYLDTVLMHSYQIVVKTNLLLIHEDRLESLYDRIQLPCAPSAGSCVTTHRTYLWSQPKLPCPLAQIKSIQAERVGDTHLISYSEKMLLNLTAEYAHPACGITKGYLTNFDSVIAVKTTSNLKTANLDARDVHPDWDWASALGYVEYVIKKRSQDEISSIHKSLCELEFRARFNTPQRLGQGRYIITRGDSYLTFTCKPRMGKILETSDCFEEVPLEGGLYVDPVTRLASEHGTPIPCSRYFPLVVRTQNVWLELPHLKTRPAPAAKNHGRLDEDALEDFSAAIIYSKSELQQFYELLTYPTYKTSRMSALMYGDCLHQAHCATPLSISSSPAQTFDLDRLSTSLTDLEASWWSGFTQYMATGGNYLSLIALLIFGLQFTIYLATGFRNSWAWQRCLELRKTLTNLRGVERTVREGENELFLASYPLKRPVDPNEQV